MRTFTRCWLTMQMIMINERFYSNSMKLDFNGNINPILSRMSCIPSPLPSWKFFRYTHRPPTLDAPLCKRNVSNIHTYLLQSQPLRDIPLQGPSAVISQILQPVNYCYLYNDYRRQIHMTQETNRTRAMLDISLFKKISPSIDRPAPLSMYIHICVCSCLGIL